MPDLGQQFDASQQKEMGFEPLPEADYKMMIDSSEIKDASTGVGNSYLQLDMRVLEGQYTGSVHIVRLNLWNSKTTAVEMANKEFGAICRACNKPQCNNSDMLHGIPFIARLKVVPPRKGQEQYGESNSAKGYDAISGAGNGAPAQSQAPVTSHAGQPAQQQQAPSNPAPQQGAPAESVPNGGGQAPPEEKPPWG